MGFQEEVEKGVEEGIEEESKINIAIHSSIETIKALGVEINDNVIDEIYREVKKSFDGLTREYVAKVVAEYKK